MHESHTNNAVSPAKHSGSTGINVLPLPHSDSDMQVSQRCVDPAPSHHNAKASENKRGNLEFPFANTHKHTNTETQPRGSSSINDGKTGREPPPQMGRERRGRGRTMTASICLDWGWCGAHVVYPTAWHAHCARNRCTEVVAYSRSCVREPSLPASSIPWASRLLYGRRIGIMSRWEIGGWDAGG